MTSDLRKRVIESGGFAVQRPGPLRRQTLGKHLADHTDSHYNKLIGIVHNFRYHKDVTWEVHTKSLGKYRAHVSVRGVGHVQMVENDGAETPREFSHRLAQAIQLKHWRRWAVVEACMVMSGHPVDYERTWRRKPGYAPDWWYGQEEDEI